MKMAERCRGPWALAAIAVSCLGLGACGTEAPSLRAARPQNVILVVFDTTRFDDWSIFEPERRATPVLDGLGARGVRFRNSSTNSVICVPNRRIRTFGFTGRIRNERQDHPRHEADATNSSDTDTIGQTAREKRRSLAADLRLRPRRATGHQLFEPMP